MTNSIQMLVKTQRGRRRG